ncbi:MAG: alpha/beta fold hydrolase [Solirubrobacteraceae bacterium]|jgi:pimeloyl-ACP methyl ester carboxylesterase
MSGRTLTLLLAASLSTAALAGVCAPRAGALEFGPCANSPGFSCTTVAVPLDRSGQVPGTISLSIEHKLAAASPTPAAVLALAGGPGQALLPLGQFVAEAIAPALATRDLLLFDQRGTGTSDPLSCPALSDASGLEAEGAPGSLAERCALELGPARGDYTTAESVEDIEAIRRAAGYERLVLYGTSYGTKVALDYAERYPQHVEALVLDSAETPEGPEPFHVSTFKAMTPVLLELCSKHACDGVTGNPVTDLAHLVSRLRVSPLTGDAYDEHGKPFKLSVGSGDLFGLLLAGDLNPALRAELPAVVHGALNHDPGPLLRLAALADLSSSSEESNEVDETLFIDTSCEETPFPWQRDASEATRALEAEAALNALPRSDFYPFDPENALLDQTIPLCISWPDASGAPAPLGPLPDVPTLILSGGQDLRTPTADARGVAKLIADAQLLTVPYVGHSVIGSDLSGCAKSALVRFFAGAPVGACGSTANRFLPAPLAPRSLSALTPMRGVGGIRGRTLTASLDTVRDLRRTIIELGVDLGKLPVGLGFGGLRGGSVRMNKTGAVLADLSYVPGVQLSGTISSAILLKGKGSPASLRISGSAAAAGNLRISSGGKLSGVLAGERFAVNVSAKLARTHAAPLSGEAEWPAPALPFPPGALARLR